MSKSDHEAYLEAESLETAIIPASQASSTLPAVPAEDVVSREVANLLQKAGTLDLTEAQKAILYAPPNEDDIEIRPDGLIYLPWMEYAERLKQTFGLNWALIPRGEPRLNPGGSSIMWGFYLFLNGRPAGYAIGEQEYNPNNARMSWGDACEGAKSNALMRLCKGIGITLELWKPSYIKAWMEKHAETYKDDKGKTKWRKKGEAGGTRPSMAAQTTRAKQDATVPPPPSPRAVLDPESDIKAIKEALKEQGVPGQEFKEWLSGYQAKLTPPRQYVGKLYNNWSFHAGSPDDLHRLSTQIKPAIKAYLEYGGLTLSELEGMKLDESK